MQTAAHISPHQLAEISKLLAEKMGLSFPENRWSDLEREIYSCAQEFGGKDPENYIQRLLTAPLTKGQIEELASHLTIGETYFFREKESFTALEQHVFPELIRAATGKPKMLRIWSAGCATGEEPYSLAILLSTIPSFKDWDTHIVATDINPCFLRKASQGIYTEWSFRATPQWVRDNMFCPKKNGQWEILPDIRHKVSFSYLNLAETPYPLGNGSSVLDIILCRNVLMYFVPEQAVHVIQNFYRMLADGGWLFVSPAETSPTLYSQFTCVQVSGALLYRKEAQTTTKLSPLPEYHPPAELPQQVPNAKVLISFSETPAPVLLAKEETVEEMPADPVVEAQSLYKNGQHEEVVAKLLPLLAAGKPSPLVYSLLARACANLGRREEALDWCEKGIASDRLNLSLYYLQATIFQEQDKREKARDSLHKALYLDQNFVLAHFALGNIELSTGHGKEAERQYEIALRLARAHKSADILPESEGMTAGTLVDIVRSITTRRKQDDREKRCD